MKTIFKTLAVISAMAMSLASCNKEISFEQKGLTHKLTFVAEQPSTKTTATVDGSTVKYSWNSSDVDRFTVYEVEDGTYTAATQTEGSLSGGVMTLMAEFSGSASADAKYQAVFNGGVKGSQSGSDTGYDQLSDVLVSELVSASGVDASALSLRFKRLVAINKVTLQGLEEGLYLGSVVIESEGEGQELTGTYSVEEDVFTEKSASLCMADVLSEVSGSSASAYFVTLPVEAAALKMTAVTLDSEKNFAAAYEKTLSKTIDFKRGDLTAFGVSMNAKTEETFDLTVVGDVQASAERISWDRALVSVVGDKNESITNSNNYYPGANKTHTRFYTGSTLTITPKCGVEIGKIVFTATSESYAKVLANSTWTNATVSYTGSVVTVIPEGRSMAVSVKIGGITGHNKIVVTFGNVAPTGVTLDKSELFLNEGETSTLTAAVTPDDAYNKKVTWTSSDTSVATVSDEGKVTALAAGTATITVTTKDGGLIASCAVTVAELEKVSTIAEIKAIVAKGTTSETKSFDANLTRVVVSYVNGNNAFVEDDTAGILIYLQGHEYKAGDVLTGDFAGTGYAYNGVSEITAITTKPTVTSGEAPDPTTVTFTELKSDFDKYDSRLVKVENVTLGEALTKKNRNSTVSQGDLSFDLYAKVYGEVILDAGLNGDIVCIPCYKGETQQLGIWATSDFAGGALKGIAIEETLDVAVGKTAALTVTFTPAYATNKNITWTSDNTAVATVSDEGVVTGVAIGTANITATSEEGDYTATCAVTVTGDIYDTVSFGPDDFTGGKASTGAKTTATNNLITISTDKGYIHNNEHIRVYKKGVITISSDKTITQIKLTSTNKNSDSNGPSKISLQDNNGTSSYSGSVTTWKGSSTKVEYNATEQYRFTSIEVVYER